MTINEGSRLVRWTDREIALLRDPAKTPAQKMARLKKRHTVAAIYRRAVRENVRLGDRFYYTDDLMQIVHAMRKEGVRYSRIIEELGLPVTEKRLKEAYLKRLKGGVIKED